jgi:hypothetical protein
VDQEFPFAAAELQVRSSISSSKTMEEDVKKQVNNKIVSRTVHVLLNRFGNTMQALVDLQPTSDGRVHVSDTSYFSTEREVRLVGTLAQVEGALKTLKEISLQFENDGLF